MPTPSQPQQPLQIVNNNQITQLVLPLADIFLVTFVILKLVHQISWSWLWVTAPFWAVILLKAVGKMFMFGYKVLLKSSTKK